VKTNKKLPAGWMPLEEFTSIYSRVPRLSVDLLLRTPEGILLTKRSTDPCKGQWHIPGGTVLFGERLVDAVHRIAKGELGITVEVGNHVGFIEYAKLAASGYFGWSMAVVYEVVMTGGELTGSFQGTEMGYFKTVPKNMIPDQADFMTGIV
jgi:ADP-ribose pyrophosphatase YjhB (NUDIX family)